MYGANSACVMTNSYYTKAAQKLAYASGVELIDRGGLTKMLSSISRKEDEPHDTRTLIIIVVLLVLTIILIPKSLPKEQNQNAINDMAMETATSQYETESITEAKPLVKETKSFNVTDMETEEYMVCAESVNIRDFNDRSIIVGCLPYGTMIGTVEKVEGTKFVKLKYNEQRCCYI